MLLPEGFALPSMVYLGPTLVVLFVAAGILWAIRPAITDRLVLAIVPWMIAGGAAHALYIVGGLPPWLAPLFGLPGVYLTLAAVAGAVWVLAIVTSSTVTHHDPAIYLTSIGSLAAVAAIAGVLHFGASEELLSITWPSVALVLAIALTAVVWLATARFFPATAELASVTGIVVIFAHVLDGVSTAVGVDILGTGERSPMADMILYIGEWLPTAAYIGRAWLFVLLKIALAVAVLVIFREYLEEAPSRARLLLALIAAVGLGPGVYNVVLFTLSI